jgi:hypothetical protein
MMTQAVPAPQRLLVPAELKSRKGIPYHLNHLRRMWKRGQFPRPVRLSPHRIAFYEHEVDAWIAARRGDA